MQHVCREMLASHACLQRKTQCLFSLQVYSHTPVQVVRAPAAAHVQRVTVHEHAILVEPLHVRHVSAGSDAARTPSAAAQLSQQEAQGAAQALLLPSMVQGRGSVRLPSEQEDDTLLIPRTGPAFSSSQDGLLLPGPGYSAEATPCSSPPPQPLRSPGLPAPVKMRRTAAEQQPGSEQGFAVASFLGQPPFLTQGPDLGGPAFPSFAFPSLAGAAHQQQAAPLPPAMAAGSLEVLLHGWLAGPYASAAWGGSSFSPS